MGWFYRLGWLAGRFIFFCTMRVVVLRPEMAQRQGPLLVACTHVSHLDPFLLGIIFARQLDWMTRIEFYRRRPFAWLLNVIDAIPVNRFGVPVSAIRTALKRLSRRRMVAICPEGGVAKGALSCMRGAPIKRGVCLLSYRSGAPVLPCAMLGTEKLNRVAPWLPFRRARLWVAFADRCIEPRMDLARRDARRVMAEALQAEYVKLFRELSRECGLPETILP